MEIEQLETQNMASDIENDSQAISLPIEQSPEDKIPKGFNKNDRLDDEILAELYEEVMQLPALKDFHSVRSLDPPHTLLTQKYLGLIDPKMAAYLYMEKGFGTIYGYEEARLYNDVYVANAESIQEHSALLNEIRAIEDKDEKAHRVLDHFKRIRDTYEDPDFSAVSFFTIPESKYGSVTAKDNEAAVDLFINEYVCPTVEVLLETDLDEDIRSSLSRELIDKHGAFYNKHTMYNELLSAGIYLGGLEGIKYALEYYGNQNRQRLLSDIERLENDQLLLSQGSYEWRLRYETHESLEHSIQIKSRYLDPYTPSVSSYEDSYMGDCGDEYICLTTIGAVGRYASANNKGDEVASMLVDFFASEPTQVIDYYVSAFTLLGPEHSVPALLKGLKDERPDVRMVSAEVLYRLELGKLGVTDDGVEYLGKLYDLGRENDPDNYVRRINASGLIAVLKRRYESKELENDTGEILGVFDLDLDSPEDTIFREVRKLTSQELFLPKANETPEERALRDDYLEQFISNYENIFSDNILEGTGVALNNLELYEQGWFLLHYLELQSNNDIEGISRLQNFVSEYGALGIKSFLALEYGGSGSDLLDFADSELLEKEHKRQITLSFFSIVQQASELHTKFDPLFSETDNSEFGPQVHEAIIRKASEYFLAAQAIARGEGNDISIDELILQMNSITAALKSINSLTAGEEYLLENNPQYQDEVGLDGNELKNATSTYIFSNSDALRVVASIRPVETQNNLNSPGGEARINFRVTVPYNNQEVRIGFDNSRYIAQGEEKRALSFDLGVKYLGDKESENTSQYATRNVSRVLSLVPGSEGGHNEESFNAALLEKFESIANTYKGHLESVFNIAISNNEEEMPERLLDGRTLVEELRYRNEQNLIAEGYTAIDASEKSRKDIVPGPYVGIVLNSVFRDQVEGIVASQDELRNRALIYTDALKAYVQVQLEEHPEKTEYQVWNEIRALDDPRDVIRQVTNTEEPAELEYA